MSEQNHANPQSKQNRIYEIIHQINKKSEDGDYIFRGEPECYEKVSSTLYRQLEKARVESPGDMVENVQSSELEEASKFTKKTDEFEILSEIQHFGGKTNLIDFTTDPYIALFFACYDLDSLEEDGRVILQDKNGAAKDWIREPRNPDPDSRVGAQKSIFVRPPKGVVVPDKKVVIPKDLKLPILTFLARQEHPISPESVYHDPQGFISSQEIRWKTYAIYSSGDDWQRKEDEAENPDEKREYYQKAADCFTEVIKRQPDNFGAYLNRGKIHASNGENARAIDDYTRAITLKPDFADAYLNRGEIHASNGENARAIDDYTDAITLKPDFADAYYNLGIVHACNGENDLAISAYTDAITLKPDFAEAYNNRGLVRKEKGNFDDAIADYTQSIELSPDSVGEYYNRGAVYQEKGEDDKAIADYTKAIALKPDFAEAYSQRGTVYGKKNEIDNAINDFDKAIKLNPNDAKAYHNRGLAALVNEKFEEAFVCLSRALELNPDDASTHRLSELAVQGLQGCLKIID